jgi:hypothetical protein
MENEKIEELLKQITEKQAETVEFLHDLYDQLWNIFTLLEDRLRTK